MSDHIRRELEQMELPEAALDIIENLQSRAEAAEQERDKLLAIVQGVYGAAINDISRWEGGMTVGTPVFQDRVFAKHLVRDLQPFILPEGSQPDATE